MGIDYARCTMPYAVVQLTEKYDLPKTFTNNLETFWQVYNEWEDAGKSATIMGWTWHLSEEWGGPSHTLGDSADHAWHPFAFLFTKGNHSIRLIREGYLGFGDYFSVGAETLESLNAFLSDIGLPDAPVVTRYVFFLIW